jgi:N-acetylglucosamine-6-phosphate deacetylase
MPSTTLFYNATVYAEQGPIERGWVFVEGSHIVQIGQGMCTGFTDAARLDLGGHILSPGLLDLHVHGALGHDTMDATPEALQQMARFYARHGVTAFLATTMSAPSKAIRLALENVAAAMRAGTGGATCLGAHVEGPYLDARHVGAQNPAHVRLADPQEYASFFATGAVKLLTLAPEYPENRELIPYALSHGIAVAAGHTRASYEEMQAAAEMGVTQVTHLFNALDPLHHRKPGAAGAALTLDGLYCQLIADNIHIHPAMLKLAVRAKGAQGIILVTDAMAGTGMPEGTYALGGLAVTVRQGEARLANGALAGSTLTLERGLRNIMAATGLSLREALPMATSVPARALGIEAYKGSLAVGQDADLIVVDADLHVRLSMVMGEIVYKA